MTTKIVTRDISDQPETSYLTCVSYKVKQFYMINPVEDINGKYFAE